MPFQLPRLPSAAGLVDSTGKPTITFQTYWQQLIQRIEFAVATIVRLTGVQTEFEAALTQAQQTAAQAQAAAAAAQAAAEAAMEQNAANAREQALANSYIDPASVLSATPTTITIAAHTRRYGDGTSVAVDGGTADATAPDDADYVSYIDPMRAGGAVVYVVSTDQPVQGGDVHVVGAVTIPAEGSATGGSGPRQPGYVIP